MPDVLKERVVRFCEDLRQGRFANEEAVRQGAILPILHALSWPVFETDIVWPEFALQGRRVDYALCHPRRKPQVLIEVKQPGQAIGADRQLFEYAFHHGVPVAVLTDGQAWHIFLPAGVGDYSERRVYKLDLVERTPEESTERLRRYLEYASVCSGKALEATQSDYRNVAREREIRERLPEAWWKLVEDRDEFLIDLLADKVESLCGYKAEPEVVHAFLQQGLRLVSSPITGPVYTQPSAHVENRRITPPVAHQIGRAPSMGFVFEGQTHSARSAADVYIQVLKVFAARYPDFLTHFSHVHPGTRRFVAQNKYDLFPNRPDFADNASRQILDGWWAGLNISRQEIHKRIELACRVAGVDIGKDITIDLGGDS